ncbi:MAG: POTRA domain-containing protein [Gammaproteobacteria bacterium]
MSSVSFSVRSLAAVHCLCAGTAAWAQGVPPVPDAGTVLRQIQSEPLPPAIKPTAPDIEVFSAVPTVTQGGVTVDVRRFELIGVSAGDVQPLQQVLLPYVGSGRSLADLEAAAGAVTAELRHRGLFLAQTIVPEQRLKDGVVQLQVFEGRLGEVTANFQPGVRVSRALVESTIEPLREEPLIRREPIEDVLLRLSDLRGIAVRSTLQPGEQPGTADLAIHIEPGDRYAAAVEYDNAGTLYTGRDRVRGSLDVFGIAGRGDVASVRAQVSTGTRYVQASWMTPVNGRGTRVGPAAAWLHYELGTAQFEPLQAEGSAQLIALQVQHPLKRSRDHNVFLYGSVGEQRFTDEVNSVGSTSRKRIDGYGSVGVGGEMHDGRAGIDTYSLEVASGRVVFGDATAAALDAQTFRAAGRYARALLSASRLQALTERDSVLFATQAQWASRNLDSSQKFSLGGLGAVRGYPPADSPVDDAVTLTWEYRHRLAVAFDGQWTASVFGDYGVGRRQHEPLAADTSNIRRLQSHGLGLTYGSDKGLSVRGFVAWRGNTPAQSDDSRARALLQASFSF